MRATGCARPRVTPLLGRSRSGSDGVAHEFLTHFQRREHGKDASNILGACAAAFFLRPTAHQGLHAAFGRALEKADPFRPAKLVRGATEECARPETVGGQ